MCGCCYKKGALEIADLLIQLLSSRNLEASKRAIQSKRIPHKNATPPKFILASPLPRPRPPDLRLHLYPPYHNLASELISHLNQQQQLWRTESIVKRRSAWSSPPPKMSPLSQPSLICPLRVGCVVAQR
jgi:hypothetical protein